MDYGSCHLMDYGSFITDTMVFQMLGYLKFPEDAVDES